MQCCEEPKAQIYSRPGAESPQHPAISSSMTTPIPSPPAIPFIGHITTKLHSVPSISIYLLAQQYGEIFELTTFGMSTITYGMFNYLKECRP